MCGVRIDSGEQLVADLVVDASGRRSQVPRWLEAAGAAPVHEESEDSGFIYYSRFFRAHNGEMPRFRAGVLTPIGTFSLLTIPSDNDTWSVTIYTASGDQPLKRLREPGLWTAVVRSCPAHAQWLDGEPISGLIAMGGILDRYRRLVVDGTPVATGVALVGDAWACTNPSQGRGMTLGLLHAKLLADVLRAHPDDPRAFADVFDAVTEAELTPWYRETVEEDRIRLHQIESLRHGLEVRAASGSLAWQLAALAAAMAYDADAFRAIVANKACLTLNREIFEDARLVERILEVARESDPTPPPGPDRDQLLALLDATPATA